SMQATLRDYIRRYNERYGATVLLTSHYMDDVTALCPRVIVIDKGRLTYDGDLSKLVHKVRPNKRVVLRRADGRQETLTVAPADRRPPRSRGREAGGRRPRGRPPPSLEKPRRSKTSCATCSPSARRRSGPECPSATRSGPTPRSSASVCRRRSPIAPSSSSG